VCGDCLTVLVAADGYVGEVRMCVDELRASVKEPRPRRSVSRHASLICQDGEGTSVTSTVMQHYIT
jgi:hypothetical protein